MACESRYPGGHTLTVAPPPRDCVAHCSAREASSAPSLQTMRALDPAADGGMSSGGAAGGAAGACVRVVGGRGREVKWDRLEAMAAAAAAAAEYTS